MKNQIKSNQSAPRIAAAQVRLLERLSNASAVSGDEGEVRKIVLEEIRPHADEIKVDLLGNVLAVRHAKTDSPMRVMVDAHMDEVGFMVIKDEGEGIFRFDIVGSIDNRYLVGKPVLVGKEHVPGVIGAKPIHLTEADETKRPISLDVLRIDVGPSNGKVKIGDRAVFATQFTRLGTRALRGKAFDDRLGVVSLIELLKHAPENIELLCNFAVQEEIGSRGASVAAFGLYPHLAIALDATSAIDLPSWDGTENVRYNTRQGAGPALYIADRSTLADPRLLRHLIETAEALSIPYQLRQPGGGGTDAGGIHMQRTGIPAISISVPTRYLHTPASIARLDDWQNTLTLVHAALQRLTPELLAVER
jgi:endoglucanase